jgi:hypothetical protein
LICDTAGSAFCEPGLLDGKGHLATAQNEFFARRRCLPGGPVDGGFWSFTTEYVLPAASRDSSDPAGEPTVIHSVKSGTGLFKRDELFDPEIAGINAGVDSVKSIFFGVDRGGCPPDA